ncbi:hypothetical protein AAMO2058_001398500 [Amorphochlora amoebiformis]
MVSNSSVMDFVQRNYRYQKMSFCEVINRATNKTLKQSLYFRSSPPLRTAVSNFTLQWPRLSSTIRLPSFIPGHQVFATILRISSNNCTLFTHYDVMDNILLQIRGRKHVVLCAPGDVEKMYLVGDKSRITNFRDIDFQRYPKASELRKYECTLERGDALYIPSLWFHSVKSLEFSASVNVFWRPLNKSIYDPKDTFGNRDPLPARRALEAVEKALSRLSELPEYYADFYRKRMVDIIRTRIHTSRIHTRTLDHSNCMDTPQKLPDERS